MHATLGKAIAGLGALILLSALVINPWVGVFYQDYIENYYDVMLDYVWWSLGLGGLLGAFGLISARRTSEGWTGAALLAATLSLVVLADRALLVLFGLPNWMPDPVVGYRHRPNTVRVLGSRLVPTNTANLQGLRYVTNQYGHHDDDFPKTKSDNELRGLMLGDSVTMGDGLEKSDTIANQLEEILHANGRKYIGYQVINTGVGGYSTHQEYAIFRESIVFDPDFVTVGLCLNDITDLEDFDGKLVATDSYADIAYLSASLSGYLTNETGFSRLISWAQKSALTLDQRHSAQVYKVRAMVEAPIGDKRFSTGWKRVLENLAAIYRLAQQQDLTVVLLVYPYTFQLFNEHLQTPQRILLDHAREHGVDAIDLTLDYEAAIWADVQQLLAESARAQEMIAADLELLLAFQARRYFIDANHPTPIGNRLAAGHLAQYLHQRGLIELDLPRFQQEQERLLQNNLNDFAFQISLKPQDIARTAYILFLLDEDVEEIRRIFNFGIGVAETAKIRAQLYRALGEIERAMGNGEAAVWAFKQAEIQ